MDSDGEYHVGMGQHGLLIPEKMFCLIHQWPLQWERNDSPVESVADTLSIFQTNPNMHPNKVACLEQTSPKFLRPPRGHFDPVHVE